MSAELERLLEEARNAFERGVQARSQGKLDEARLAYLQAAERLYLAAQRSQGRLRQTRKQLAAQLVQEADELQPPQGKPAPAQASRPAAAALGDDQQAAAWLVQERPQISFADVAGLEEVKQHIRLKLLYPFTHPEIASRYGIQPGGGILLYGPPGTGKTLIARAIAGEIQAAFYAIKPSEVMSQWVGVAEQNIARLFADANSYERSVIFIDEIEALAPRRRSSGSTVMQRVVPQILAELDGFEKRPNALLLVGATNEPWALDSAILRPGRLDRLIYVPPPDLAARQHILELNLKSAPLGEEVSLEELARLTEGFSGADMAALAQRARERVFSQAVQQGVTRPLDQSDFMAVLSGMRPSIPQADLRLFEQFALGERPR